jgi:DNA-directed RNA polymerase alpha subunit
VRVYKSDRCGSYYDVQSQIGPFYAEVQDEHEVYSIDGKPTIKGKDLCDDCMKDLKRWFVLCDKEEKIEVTSEDIHDIPIAELGLSTRVETIIKRNVFGIVSIGDIVDLDLNQIRKMRGMGKNSINELVNKLREFRIPYVLHMLDNGNGMFVRKYEE